MSTYTPAGISACDIDVARRNLRKTPPNSPPRPAAKQKPQEQKRVTPRDLELVPVLLCVARVAYVARPRHALELVLLLVACREGSASTTLALPCAATALAAALSTSNLDALRAATIATAAYATAPEQSWKALAAVLAAVLTLLEAPRSFVWCALAMVLQDAAQMRLTRRVAMPPSRAVPTSPLRGRAPLPEPAATDRRGELQLVAQLGALAGVHVAMDLWRGTCGLAPMVAARVAPLAAGAALLSTPVDDDADAFLAGVFHVDVNHALIKRLGGYYGAVSLTLLVATRREPIISMLAFVLTWRRLAHVVYWALAIVGGVYASTSIVLPRIERRKLFHALVVLLFAPSTDELLLGVAFGGAAFLMLAVEEARARRLLSLDEFYGRFLDQRDSSIALTHIYLLLGCALPHGLNLILKHDGADCLVLKLGGVAVLGCGDALACVIGRRFGKKRWPGSQKTYVGSAAFVGGTFAFFLFYRPIYVSRGQLVLDSVIIAILEATVTSVDNLVLPLYFSALALCAVAVDRSQQFPLAELLHDL